MYSQLNIKHEPLGLIAPQFEVPLPPLQLAVFAPPFRELPPPQLELFDLDDLFSSDHVRLAQVCLVCQSQCIFQVTNKCTEEDVDYYVQQAGDIVGVSLPAAYMRSGKHILEYVLNQIVEYKRYNPDAHAQQQSVYEHDGDHQDVHAHEFDDANQQFIDEGDFSDIDDDNYDV
jgi:intraflagellar transport protein 52